MKTRNPVARNPVARNPVAKHMRSFNRVQAQIDRKQQLKSGYSKHRKNRLKDLSIG
jgi:hypothetical protein